MKSWNVAAGRFFFRYRNSLFPIVFLIFLILMRPRVLFGRPIIDHQLALLGTFVAIAGQMVRLLTIGFDYIDRGGKKGRPAASRLVQGGIYAHTRNPMYLGNILIAVGLTMSSGSPVAYVTIIPFFLFVYNAITAAEESFLREEFGAEYKEYCTRVPRFFPSLRGLRQTLSQGQYNWKRAVRQDLSTLTWVSMTLAALPLWRIYFLEGTGALQAAAPRTAVLEAGILAVYLVLIYLKGQRRLFY